MPRTVAVTGGSGMIGRRLLPLLATQGIALRVLTRSGVPLKALTSVQGDLRDAVSLRELVQGADTVVHLAGVAHTQFRNAAEQAQAREINVGGTRALLEAAREAGVRHFVLMSSAHVYAGQRGTGLSESSATAAGDGYAGMKLAAEDAVLEAAEQGMAVTILRPCLVYGPGVRFNLASLISALRRGLYVHEQGARVERSFASVDAVAAAVAHVLQRRCGAEIFNVADEEPVLLEAWVNGLAEAMKVRRPYAVPQALLRGVAALGSAAAALGLPAPLTRASLAKLTTSFSLHVGKLAESGFVWPANQEAVIREMIESRSANA